MMGVGGLLLALVVHTVLASSDTSSESMAKVRFGDDGMLVLFRNASEDVLHCTGTIEAANVRIAGTTTTVADVIRQLATLQSDMESVKQHLGMLPPTSPPPPTPVCKGVYGRATLGWNYGIGNSTSGMCYSASPGHEICSTISTSFDWSSPSGSKYTGDEACQECGKCLTNEACATCGTTANGGHANCNANFPNGCT